MHYGTIRPDSVSFDTSGGDYGSKPYTTDVFSYFENAAGFETTMYLKRDFDSVKVIPLALDSFRLPASSPIRLMSPDKERELRANRDTPGAFLGYNFCLFSRVGLDRSKQFATVYYVYEGSIHMVLLEKQGTNWTVVRDGYHLYMD